MSQLNADQVDTGDHPKELLEFEDANFMIVKIDAKYIVCDKSLPFRDTEEGGTMAQNMGFSFDPKFKCLPFIEKALAVYLGSYH